jgi:ParB family transcriptional regulator, chromosome partitioning protein
MGGKRVSTERRLGRGLESLLGADKDERVAPASAPGGTAAGPRKVPVASIRPNPLQPRTAFTERELDELTESIRAVGILQPLMVRKAGAGYELIAGERRLRAAKQAGLTEVPVIEREVSDDDMLTLALVENLQREDLNAIEKAKGFRELIEKHSLTQEAASKRLGKDRTTIANFMRLLELPEVVQHVVSRGTISMGHARALLGLPTASAQQALALRIEEEGLSVRQVENLVAAVRAGDKRRHPRRPVAARPAHLRDIEDRARQRFGTKVQIEHAGGKGKMTIHFYSDDDFQRVLEILGLAD